MIYLASARRRRHCFLFLLLFKAKSGHKARQAVWRNIIGMCLPVRGCSRCFDECRHAALLWSSWNVLLFICMMVPRGWLNFNFSGELFLKRHTSSQLDRRLVHLKSGRVSTFVFAQTCTIQSSWWMIPISSYWKLMLLCGWMSML